VYFKLFRRAEINKEWLVPGWRNGRCPSNLKRGERYGTHQIHFNWDENNKGPYRPDAIWQRDANFQFSMTFNFAIFLCFSNIRNHLNNFSYLVCISCKIFIRWRFYMILKTENSRSLPNRVRSVWALIAPTTVKATAMANEYVKPNDC
jgi:hypothetical protein